MPKVTEATRSARQARILRAAVACFARQGYYRTTMEEIAAEAGIAKGAAYVHFPGKEAIFVALYETWGCTTAAHLRRGAASCQHQSAKRCPGHRWQLRFFVAVGRTKRTPSAARTWLR
jgi:AcrR family transcriptional regulator